MTREAKGLIAANMGGADRKRNENKERNREKKIAREGQIDG